MPCLIRGCNHLILQDINIVMFAKEFGVISDSKKCPTCPVVDVVCYWGEMPQERWKRPFIFIVTLLAEIALVYWMFFSNDPDAEVWLMKLIAIILGSFCGLGLVASIWGCDKCVAQVCGKAKT
ncbi:hypothetical protein Glaag_1826 [Glaciecola sp. 4H-3-7+YE-5]|nr:hypothetical protein Glaag_1826 [Glaciecola sp. 4H-3-7+YE-5]